MFNIPSVSFLTPFLCDNVCLNRRKVAFNHSFTKFRIYKRRMREFFLIVSMDLSGVSPYLTTKNIIYHLYLQNNIDMLQVCKIRDINVSGKINKITTTQKITLISNNVRYYALQYIRHLLHLVSPFS